MLDALVQLVSKRGSRGVRPKSPTRIGFVLASASEEGELPMLLIARYLTRRRQRDLKNKAAQEGRFVWALRWSANLA